MSNVPHSAVHATQYEDVDSQKKSSGVVSCKEYFCWREMVLVFCPSDEATRPLVQFLRGSSYHICASRMAAARRGSITMMTVRIDIFYQDE